MSNVVITKEVINAVKTERGGFTRRTLEALGLSYPLVEGWANRLIGTTITQEAYEDALAGRTSLSKTQQKRLRRSPPPAAPSLASDAQARYLVDLGVPPQRAFAMTAQEAFLTLRTLLAARDRAKQLNRELDEAWFHALAGEI